MKKLLKNKTTTIVGFLMATLNATSASAQIDIDSVEPENSSDATVEGTLQGVINILLFVVGAGAVIMLIIGAIRYVVSAGDQQAVAGAKNTIIYAIVGIVVAVMAFAIVNFVLGPQGLGAPADG